MNRKPLVSVLICAYNVEKYIDECISSVINQTYKNLEIVIVNDGSTDSTLLHLEKFKEIDRRVNIVNNPSNLGFVSSLNIGVNFCAGQYIARIDSDDIATSFWIEKIIESMENNPNIIAMGAYVEIIVEKETGVIGSQYNNGDIWKNPLDHYSICEAMLFNNVMHNNTVIMRKKFFFVHNLRFNPDYLHAEDYKFWSDVSQIGEIANYPAPLVLYRLHSNQTSSIHNKAQTTIARKIRRENITRFLMKNNVELDITENISILNIYSLKNLGSEIFSKIFYEIYMSLDNYGLKSFLHFLKYHFIFFSNNQRIKIIKKFLRKSKYKSDFL